MTGGVEVVSRELIQLENGKSSDLLWSGTALLILLLTVEGLCAFLVTGLGLNCSKMLLYGGSACFCVSAAVFFRLECLDGRRRYILMGITVVYGGVLFVTQEDFIRGAAGFLNGVIRSINRNYENPLQLMETSGGSGSITLFLMELLFLCVLLLASAIVYNPDILPALVLVFPAVSLLFLCGGEPSPESLLLLLFGLLGTFVLSRTGRKKKLWGSRDSRQYRRNLKCHERVQKTAALLVCAAGLVLAVPAFYGVRPFLNLQAENLEEYTARVKGRAVEQLVHILPKITGGKVTLRVETAGGGVSDGSLRTPEGYMLGGIEDLRLTSSLPPGETIYLKGFIGSVYTGTSWEELPGRDFDNAALNWKTEDDPRLYIQNLPFLRALYQENDSGTEDSGMAELVVERLNANPGYTYVPYYAYLNEYYQIDGGDGAAAGQELQEDRFSYYPGNRFRDAVETWNSDDDKQSVLDRVQDSYGAFVKDRNLEVPGELEAFKEKLLAEAGDRKLGPAYPEETENFIRAYLGEHYTFEMTTEELPEGKDFLEYFLEESGQGYSIHFASAGTMMFRMFGIPARYVTGYAAPSDLFSAQPDGTYTAVLQDDNAHAWTEIYVDKEGWRPVECTPGAFGKAEQIPAWKDEGGEDKAGKDPQDTGKEQGDGAKGSETGLSGLTQWLDGSLGAVIRMIFRMVVGAAAVVAAGYVILRIRRVWGLGRHRPPEDRIRDLFGSFCHRMVRCGMPPSVESTSPEFREWAGKLCPQLRDDEIERMMDLVLRSSFGCRGRTEAEVVFMREMYRKCGRQSRKLKKPTCFF